MSEAWHLQVQFLSVLFHDVGKVFVCESEIAYFLHVRVNQRYELVIALQYDALVYHCQGIEFVLYFFRIDILTVRTEKHVLAASLDEYVAVTIHGAEVTGMIPSVLIDGLLGSFLILIVTQHHVRTLSQNLSWYILWVWTVDANHHVESCLAAGTRYEMLVILVADDRRTLGSTISYSISEAYAMQETFYFLVSLLQ